MNHPDPAVELEDAAQLVAKAACNCGTCMPHFVESVRNVAALLGFDLVRRTPQSEASQEVAESAAPAMLPQISSQLPWVVLGWRHFDDDEIAPDLIGVYGPVSSKQIADGLAAALAQTFPTNGDLTRFTVEPAHPVRTGAEPAVVAG